jgi:hypothetical protein
VLDKGSFSTTALGDKRIGLIKRAKSQRNQKGRKKKEKTYRRMLEQLSLFFSLCILLCLLIVVGLVCASLLCGSLGFNTYDLKKRIY